MGCLVSANQKLFILPHHKGYPTQHVMGLLLVGATGVEPARITPLDPKSNASANSATRPSCQSIFAASLTPVNTFYRMAGAGARSSWRHSGR